jgi:nucleoside-diphosphate-sugar epimerase
MMRRKLRKPRLLIVGCGDIGMRLLPLVRDRYRVFALTHDPSRRQALRTAGAVPVVANLDDQHSLIRIGRLAPTIVHLAPPPAYGTTDRRTRNLLCVLPDGAKIVYASTTGVYGDCAGALIDETRPVNPQTDRARRRVDAERQLRAWGRRNGNRVAILRVPGIYAADRLPVERLQKGLPALVADEDVHTNHIHADDLARIIALALFRVLPNRLYHASDDTELKMGEYFDLVAEALHLPKPPRLPREQLQAMVSPMALSFMSESRRLGNARLKRELGIRLRYPFVQDALRHITGGESENP